MAEPFRRIGDLLADLKRRKVFRVMVVYAAVGFVIVETADMVIPALDLPEWVVTLVVVLVLLGFPIALVLAWAFDLTPEGVRRTPEPVLAPDGDEQRPAERSPVEPPGVEQPEAATSGLDTRAVAVLPFDNLSGTAEAEPFTAGLHDDLLTQLSRVSALTVISRTSVMGYRGTGKSIGQIGRELGVGTVVEGAVQHAAGRVRLNVQLIDARTDAHRWAETFDRKLTTDSIFDIQTELADRITDTLRAELTPAEKARVQRVPTEDLEAYRLYTEGRTHLDQRSESAVGQALARFQEAILRDPDYGLAWAGLAQALVLVEFYDYAPPAGAPEHVEAVRRAVELAPDAGETHTALGISQAMRQDAPAALSALERSLELKPSDAESHIWLSWVHLIAGNAEEALPLARRAVDLDPRAPAVRTFLAEALLANGEVVGAVEEAKAARELQSDYPLASFMQALALYHLDRYDEAASVLEEILPHVRPRGIPSRAEVQALLALTHTASGSPNSARELLGRVRETDDRFSTGLIHAALLEYDQAFRDFEAVEKWWSFSTEMLRYFFPDVLGPLREDPRYARLLAAVDRSWGLGPRGLPARGT